MKQASVLLKQDIGVRKDNVLPFRETAAVHQIPLAPPPVPQNPSPYFEVEDEGLAEDFRLPTKYVEDEPILMEDEINVALRFADRAKFFEMCEDSLWGNEQGLDPDDEQGQKLKQRFGEMLRGLVIQFKPRNEIHLHLLSTIADAQWELERFKRYKKSVYTVNEKKAGSNGMRAGTELGFSFNRESDRTLDRLNKAIDVYLKTIKRV